MDSFTLAAKDRQFEINGEVFTWKIVKPEVLETFQPNGKKKEVTWKDLDDQIVMFLEDEGHDRWRVLRDRTDDAVSIGQIGAVVEYLWEKQAQRPTKASSA